MGKDKFIIFIWIRKSPSRYYTLIFVPLLFYRCCIKRYHAALELPQRFDPFIFPRSHLFSRPPVSSIPVKRVFGEIRGTLSPFSTKTLRFFVESTEKIRARVIMIKK